MTAIERQTLEKIRTNRISTTEVADCLGKRGALPGMAPLNRGHFEVGRVFFAYAYGGSNWELHEQLREVKRGDVVMVESHGCEGKALFGELVAKYLLLYKGATAIVANGLLRDAHRLYRENWPIWSLGVTPVGCINKPNNEELDPAVHDDWRSRYEGAVAVCDDGGVVIVPKADLTQDFLKKLDFIEIQEDIWFFCVDTKKWSTYETVCKKRYLETELLPDELRRSFEEFETRLDDTD